MKCNLLLSLVLSVLLTGKALAQDFIEQSTFSGLPYFIPTAYTQDGKLLFYTVDDGQFYGADEFLGDFCVFDENFEEINRFSSGVETYETYNLVKRREPVTDPFTGVVTYTGEWKSSRENENEFTDRPVRSLMVCSEENGVLAPMSAECASLFLTQTLFNEDEKFEYIYVTAGLKAGTPTERDRDGDGQIDEIRTSYSVSYTGVEVRQDDGTVLLRCDFEGGSFGQDVRTILYNVGGKTFLLVAGTGYTGSIFQTKSWIYSIDKKANKISEVKTMSGMRAYPNPLRKGETVTIQLPSSCKEGSEHDVRIVSMDGRVLLQKRVGADERSAQIPLQGFVSGIYNFTVVEDGRPVETQRVMVW